MHHAQDIGITLDWEISLPKGGIPVSDIDMCEILGNILENAILACKNVSEKRYIELAIRSDSSGIYIVTTNSFDGMVDEKDGRYLSTRGHKTGLGLKSITSTAEKYGGAARFSHKDKEFYTDVVLPTK